jgi:pyridoxine 5-phosphate synthase
MTHQRLYINIDHIATVRQARRGGEPVPAHAVGLCERSGADGITAHLREDRRHIQDADIHAIAAAVTTVFNLEIACTAEMLALAERLRPHQVTLVPERREEVTTEGGLALAPAATPLTHAIRRLRKAGIRSSLFIDPDRDSVTHSRDLGADAVELHTGR